MLAEGISTAQQEITRMPVGALAEMLAKQVSDKPALILYGPLAAA
jgi:uroporphyrin-III C-methyltransferase